MVKPVKIEDKHMFASTEAVEKERKKAKKSLESSQRFATNSLYDWATWFSNKEPFSLVKGVDYSGQTHSMVQQIRNKASKSGYRASIQVYSGREDKPDELKVALKKKKIN